MRASLCKKAGERKHDMKYNQQNCKLKIVTLTSPVSHHLFCVHGSLVSRPFQFLIAYCMQKRRGKAWEKESHAWRQVDMRVDMRGAVPDKESWGPSLSDNLRLQHSKDSVNTVCCPVDSRLINAEFVSYNDWSPPPSRLPSHLPDVTHVTLSPRPSPSVFAYSMWSKTGGRNGLGMRLCAWGIESSVLYISIAVYV